MEREDRWTIRGRVRARREAGVTQCKVTCLDNVMHRCVTYRQSVQHYTSLMGRDNRCETLTMMCFLVCKEKKQEKD